MPVGYAAGLPRAVVVAALAALFLAALLVEWARRRSPLVRERFTRLTGALLREHEHAGLAGATWLLGAFLLAAVVAPPPAAITAMWAVAVGDSAAAIVGRLSAAVRAHVRPREARPALAGGVRHERRSSGGKTMAGSVSCALLTCVGALWLARLTWSAALVAGVAAAVAERPSRPLDDNLRIVLVVLLALLAVELASA